MNSKQLWNRRKELAEAMGEAVKAENMDEAHRIEGEIRALDKTIQDVLEEEEAARNALATPVAKTDASLGEKLFGARDSFDGIRDGFRRSVSVRDAVSGLSTPQIYRYDIEGPLAPPTGFLSTLPHGTTEGDEHFFLTPTFTNNAQGWTSGNKAESSIEWEPAVAHIETIAHQMPIQKQVARRYGQLESIVANSLMLGLDLKCNALSLFGSNNTGIVGVCNTSGIISHTKVAAANLKDTFQTMARKVRVQSGMAPNYIALSPYAIEALSQTKDDIGRYIFPDMANGSTVAGLTIVEDVNMTVTSGNATKETALVYYSGGASFNVADPAEVTIGLVNAQLIQNAYTILAELTADLKVTMPKAFCYCADLGLDAEQ